jgi:hypothetical protein
MMASTVRALGVHCTPKAIYFATAEAGEIVTRGPQKVEVPDGLRSGSSLTALVEELRRRLAETAATHGALLQPQSYEGGPKAVIARVGAETLLRATGADIGLNFELLNRSTARSRLGMNKSGPLDERIAELLPHPIGKYWAEGRRYAAVAALACEKATT